MDPLTKKVGVRQIPKQDHLVCFIGGLMMLGTTNGRPAAVVREDEITMEQKIYWTAGQALTKTCMDTYTQSNTGLGAEIVHYFNEHITPKRIGDRTGRAWFIKRAKGGPPPHDAKYMLRPETVESIFVSWRLTGDPIYRDWGWRIFQAIEKHCKVATGGYATLKDVDSAKAGLEDRMETFFLVR
ncbi:mannosyl-oligosaccharide alpha-1,2-mannosidase [Cystobasidiomycetes sp. EMM_F5]